MWKVHVMDLGELSRIWRVVMFLIPNLTRCKKVDTKSDKTKTFLFKIMLFTKKYFIQNRAF